MEDIINTSKDRETMKKELLAHLQKFEEEEWEGLAWQHMHLKKIKCLTKPQKLAECGHYRVIKSWLMVGSIVLPQQSNQEGLVRYRGEGLEKLEEGKAFVESVYFSLWLAKGETICIISYGTHKFNNKIFESNLGNAGYSIVFKDLKEVFLQFISNQK